MSANSYDDLARHVGHEVEVVFYGTEDEADNVSCECLTCNEVIVDFDREEGS